MEGIWDIKKIKEILPQSYPFLFIDRVLEVNEKEGKVTCLKNVSINDYFFEGHFPGKPVMPGAIIIEAMAQACIVLFATLKPKIAERHPNYFLGRVEAKFTKPVRVGDQLILEVHKEKILDRGGVVKAYARVDEDLAAEARIAFGVKPKEPEKDDPTSV
jgi:3-hydroxyacyl-[acyl-carrier-protein] dehydratase